MTRNWMEYKGFKARIMEAERLTGEGVHGLPPGYELPSYPADLFEKWPENWMKKGAFLIPVKPNKGLWFDWRANDPDNTAIIPTVKGCNPLTGMQTSGFHMEKYETKCPKHGCDFLADRFCPECKYKWVSQGYVSQAPLWLDGWVNTEDGSVRQFFFTEDELRDVASALISKENTVPAFGFAFYRPKQWRQVNRSNAVYLNNNESLYSIFNAAPVSGTVNCFSSSVLYSAASNFSETLIPDKGYSVPVGSSASASCDVDYEQKTSGGIISPGISPTLSKKNSYQQRRSDLKCSTGPESLTIGSRGRSFSKSLSKSPEYSKGLISDGGMDSHIIPEERAVKEVFIGAGAKIEQILKNDPYPLDSWKDTPDAVMTLYFVFQEKFEELKAGGLRDLTEIKEGMLANIPVG